MATSPLVVDEKLIVLPGGSSGQSIVAYNKLTGQLIWKALDDKQAYVSPMLATLAGQRQILNVTATRALGLSPDGKLLWEYPWPTSNDINVAQPVLVDGERFILSSGYGHGAAMVRVSRNGDGFTATRVWENTRMKNKFSSSVLHEGHIYGLDESILACVNADTGELKWKGGRYGYGQIVLAGANVIVAAEDGDLALVRATPERHEELVRFSAIEGKTWNHPAIENGILLVRNTTEMSAFRID
jgi:outer membrane protein assembly factor BamB